MSKAGDRNPIKDYGKDLFYEIDKSLVSDHLLSFYPSCRFYHCKKFLPGLVYVYDGDRFMGNYPNIK